MMKVAGLLPIAFRGVTYNIPICVWVPQQYPTMPPTPFVQPTPDMDVVRGHQHVGADGMCYFPYCNQWSPHSSASGLLDAMVAAFSAHPPVTARAPPVQQAQAAPAPAPQYQPPPVVGRGGGYSQPYTAKPTGGGACSVPAPSPAPAPPPTYQTSGTEQQVTARIVDGMNRRGQELQTEMGKLLDDQTELQQGQTRLDTGMQQLREEQAGLEREYKIIVLHSKLIILQLKTSCFNGNSSSNQHAIRTRTSFPRDASDILLAYTISGYLAWLNHEVRHTKLTIFD